MKMIKMSLLLLLYPLLLQGQVDFGLLYAVNPDGSPVVGFPLSTGSSITSSPVIDDIDFDGKNEILVVSGYGDIHVWDSEGDAGLVEWGHYRHDQYNSGNHGNAPPCRRGSGIISIAANTTWESNRILENQVVVNTGATLTIKGRIAIPEGYGIAIERGATLILDGGALTNACSGFWQGIELWGDISKPQTLPFQGMVKVMNGGTIENAVCGIKTIRMEPNAEGVDPDYSGGIIWADNARFINNKTAVEFYSYPGYQSSSHFYRCEFTTTRKLLQDAEPDYFIKMTGIEGINIRGCEFKNSRLAETCTYAQRGTGIYSLNAHYYVREFESGGQTWQTKFENLMYGVKALGISTDKTVSIKNSLFTNNYRSAYLSGIPQAEVTGNEFLCLEIPELFNSYGLYLDGCSGYDVWENYFYSENENGESIGLIVNNSNLTGDEENLIYDNVFYQLNYAALAQNENRSITGYPGLQFKCNDFSENSHDLAVTYEGEPSHRTGIRAGQGSVEFDPTAPAGNRFSYAGSVEDPTDIINEAQHIDYYYHDQNLNLMLMPQFYTEETVDIHLNEQPWNEETCCPPLYGGGGGTDGLLGDMADAEIQIDSISAVIQALEDAGDTEALKWEVDMSSPPQAQDVYNELMAQSPYVSDSVMVSAVEKENVLVDAMIRDIMVANPESSKNDELIKGLEQRTNPPPSYMMGQILQGRSLVSVYGALHSKLAFQKMRYATAFSSLARYYLNNRPDSLVWLLSGAKDLHAAYNLSFLHLALGDTAAGQNLLNNIPASYNLTTEQTEAHNNTAAYYNLLAQAGPLQPDSLMVQALEGISGEPGLAGVYARNILRAYNNLQYEEPVLLPDPFKSGKKGENFNEYLNAVSEIRYLEVYPNPASGHIILSWKLDREPDKAMMEIRNTEGKVLMQKPVATKEGKEVLVTGGLKPGVYICVLYFDGKQKESVKFTVTN